MTIAAAASSTKPSVEHKEITMTLKLTFDIAAPSLLRMVGHQEPFRKRPVTDLAGVNKRKGSEAGVLAM